MDIKHYYENTEMTQQQIAEKLGIPWKRVFKYIKNNYSSQERKERKSLRYSNSKQGVKNPMYGKFGEDHHNFVGVVGDSKGYLMILKPSWFTGRKGSKHVFLHNVVVCLDLGITEIPAGWCVHHCDQNPHNNDISNLLMMKLGDHARLHHFLESATTISKESTAKWLEAHGTPYKV